MAEWIRQWTPQQKVWIWIWMSTLQDPKMANVLTCDTIKLGLCNLVFCSYDCESAQEFVMCSLQVNLHTLETTFCLLWHFKYNCHLISAFIALPDLMTGVHSLSRLHSIVIINTYIVCTQNAYVYTNVHVWTLKIELWSFWNRTVDKCRKYSFAHRF